MLLRNVWSAQELWELNLECLAALWISPGSSRVDGSYGMRGGGWNKLTIHNVLSLIPLQIVWRIRFALDVRRKHGCLYPFQLNHVAFCFKKERFTVLFWKESVLI